MNFRRNKTAMLTMAILPFLTVFCAEPQSETIHDAQACLDVSNAATAPTCYAMVNGNTSAAASLIRCAAILIEEGYGNPTSLQTALTSMVGASNQNSGAMNALAFRASAGAGNASNATDLTQSILASTQCAASGSTGLSMLGAIAGLATVISNGAGTQSAAGFATYANANAGTIAGTGNNSAAMYTAYQQNCTGTISGANQAYCTQYSAALASSGGNTTTAGVSFLTNLK